MKIEEVFPYPDFRPGQHELASRIYENCIEGKTLIAEAMSGFGKTAAVLSGVIPAAEELGCRVVYACRTKRQIHRVIEELSRLQKKHSTPAASMLSKFDYCLLRQDFHRQIPRQSFGWYCWFNVSNNLCSYFLNVALLGGEFDRTVKEVLHEIPTHQRLLERSKSIHVCPYEVERLAVADARITVVPYHYVFDPKSAAVLFGRNLIESGKTILVVDEAHNLREFLANVGSSTLTLEQLEGAITEARALQMERAATSIAEFKHGLKRAVGEYPGWFLDRETIVEEFRKEKGPAWLQNLSFELTACSEAAWGSVAYERKLPSLLLAVGEFLVRLTSSPRGVLLKWDGTLALIDPDPVHDVAAFLSKFRSSILVSATISPSPIFIRSLGLDSGTATYYVRADPALSVRTVIVTGVTTRFKSRGFPMYTKISDRISSIIEATKTGVGVFVPSYAVLEPISQLLSQRLLERRLLEESRGMDDEDVTDLLDSLWANREPVLLAVQGGRFSEGEDFRDDLMGAVVVVGLSLPPPTPKLFAEFAYLRKVGETDSYLMLSRLPAIRKAFQAAGRHVRRPGKRGLVFFMDDRFDSASIRDLMPSWMKNDIVRGDFTPPRLKSLTNEFWAAG